VATLIARQAPQPEVFGAAAQEIGRTLGVQHVRVVRYENPARALVVASWGRDADGVMVGDPARPDPSRAEATAAILVDGRRWGAVTVASTDDPLRPEVEARLAEFTDLLATAIANAEARIEAAAIIHEQAALRRIATLVAEAAPPDQLFSQVAEEVAGLLGEHVHSAILRYEVDETATVMAVRGGRAPTRLRPGARVPVDGEGVTARVRREHRPVRVDSYTLNDGAIARAVAGNGVRAAVGCPVVVHGRLWGAMIVARYSGAPFAAATESRIAQFAELVATAIDNTEARAGVRRLAEEQAALRRVATLVAEGAAPAAVFDAVVAEVAQLLGAAQVGLARYEGEREISVLAMRGHEPSTVGAGVRLPLDGESLSAQIRRSGRSGRFDHRVKGDGTVADVLRRNDISITVGAPIVVDGGLWGMIGASWKGADQPAADAEERLAQFAQLVDTAIANADSRAQLTASRARMLSAGDDARRRVVRDLHDGAQQRLVHAIITLKLAQRAIDEEPARAKALLAEALAQAEQGNADLRELAHGILPSVLTRGGLRAAVDSLVSRLELPVDVSVSGTRLPADIEASAYFIVAEALTNVVKHARAATARVVAAVDDGALQLEIGDDGIGGADTDGPGLTGIGDRLAALGGSLRIDSPLGGGTLVAARLPLPP
jgi:signal transduction histidine kinase